MIEYKTSDIWFAANLLCQGAVFERVTSGEGKRKAFVLSWSASKLTEASRDYYRGSARVDPRELRHRLTDLKGVLSSRAIPPSGQKGKEQKHGASSAGGSAPRKREENHCKGD